MEDTRRRQVLTGKQHRNLTRILDECLKPDGKLWKFDEGWNDDRVAEEAMKVNDPGDPRIHTEQAKRYRVRAYGQIKNSPGEGPHAATGSDIREVVQQVLDMRELILGQAKINQRVQNDLGDADERIEKLEADMEQMRGAYLKLFEWAQAIARAKGYVPPQGRPQASPPDTTAHANGPPR
jgi:hypothetical protein